MTKLVSSHWLKTELANGFGFTRDQILLEVGCGAPDRSDHIPGSVWLDTNQIETEERCWSLVEDDLLLARLGERGISHASDVVIAGEPLVSARVAWALEYAGVGAVQILDGGFRAWAKSGPLSSGWLRPRAIDFGIDAPRGKHVRATRDDVRGMLAANHTLVADVRSRAEHDGNTSGYSYIHARGRIEGSVFARGGPSANFLEDYTREDGTFADCDRVADMWRELGIAERACFYCGTGWRASVAYLFAGWLGFEEKSVYDGGWFDWSSEPANAAPDFHRKAGRREVSGVGPCSTRPAR
jgi:thiosulfate/3-mercaptopyruvate sulfurtransferase